MKITAKSWPEVESAFQSAKLASLTAETEEEARVLGQLATILRLGVPVGFEKLLTEFIQKNNPS